MLPGVPPLQGQGGGEVRDRRRAPLSLDIVVASKRRGRIERQGSVAPGRRLGRSRRFCRDVPRLAIEREFGVSG
jgi:hypothetical protein